MQREELQFGHGSFVGAIMRDPDFFEIPVDEQARILGWADSCPVVEDLIRPDNPDPGRGSEAMRGRYGQVNFWFGEIGRLVKSVNPELNDQLMEHIPRQEDEPIGKHEPQSVPLSNYQEISPMGTLPGYVLPRLFIEQLGINKDLSVREVQDRLVRGIDILGRAAITARSPLDLLALTADGILRHGDVSSETVLKQVYSLGWLGEHNAHSILNEFKTIVNDQAPHLRRAYAHLSEEEKINLKVA